MFCGFVVGAVYYIRQGRNVARLPPACPCPTGLAFSFAGSYLLCVSPPPQNQHLTHARQGAKTEMEKLKFEDMTCKEAMKQVCKM